MQTQLLKEINSVLKGFPQYWNGETLKRSEVITAIENKEPLIIKALASNEKLKQQYSTDIDGILLFDFAKLINLIQYKEYWKDSFTKYKNKIGLTSNGNYLIDSGDIVLDFPFKDCMLEGGMSKSEIGKNEVFYNEIIAADEIDRLKQPKVLVNAKRYSADGVEDGISKITSDDNLIIKGNNLLVLHSLVTKFRGKVKLIYIDPPYNTGNDSFKYNDKFNHSTWLTFMKNRLEIARELLADDGVIFVQCDDNEQAYLKVLMDEIFGRENSKVTLYVQVRFANKTLNEDNDYQKIMEHIFVYSNTNYRPNKDKIEYSYDSFCYEIKELEKGKTEIIGGREVIIFEPHQYRIDKVKPHKNALKETWATGSLVKQGGSAAEFLHLYLKERKDKDGLGVLYKVIGMGTKGDGLGYRYITGPKQATAINGKFYTGIPIEKQCSNENAKTIPIKNLLKDEDIYIDNFWDYKDSFGNCRTQGGVAFNGGKKPEQLLKRIIEIATNESDIILDYHLGSGTTAAVAHKMNRQYIGIEQMDYIETLAVERLKKVIDGEQGGISKEVNWQGGGSFVYCELAKLNQNYVDSILRAESTEQLNSILDVMQHEAYLNYQIELENLLKSTYEVDGVEHEVEFSQLSLAEQKELLIALLDKNQLYVNLSEIDDVKMKISDTDKKFTQSFYQLEI
ncbi:DNA polymerase [Gallibacterium salpingitidis]|uniref:DNA methyltransferase n=1 Tax=Gallibacterium salpingitidis TaxID=505341 RepID=UPI00080496B6|nr:site-specific DNA-methyltransferase [Gallibacterium salpingitidis]OBX06380.1 DNA polymerase [Gallibacterium salpingitidis]